MLGEDAAAEVIDFTEGDCSHSRSLKSKAEPADAGEEIEDIQFLSVPLGATVKEAGREHMVKPHGIGR
jgi:hypothetical protein